MSKKVLALATKGMDANSLLIANNKVKAYQFDCESSPLGEGKLALSRYVDFLIKAGLVELEQAQSIATNEDVKAIIKKSLSIVYALKLSCIFTLGKLTLFANQYGVIQYYLNKDYPFKGMCCVEFPAGARLIIEVFEEAGVTSSSVSFCERKYDYRPLKHYNIVTTQQVAEL